MTATVDYQNKVILAPMVRIGTLPMRLLSLEYGADLVYTEELIDWKLIRSERVENSILGTVDYVDLTDGTVVFRTCPVEKDKVILQIGTSDPDRALQVARKLQNDVAAIDINMGCPKEFSIKGGMGAALLSDPDKAVSILSKLVNGVQIPVTCKVRVLETEESTVALCSKFADCGISAIAVHGRTKEERPQHSNRNSFIRKVTESLSIPVIANGGSKEITQYSDIGHFKELTGASSVMIARAAEWNASIFRKEGKLPLNDIIKRYLEICIKYDNPPANTKYCIQNMLRELQETPTGKALLDSQTLLQICDVWGLGEQCKTTQRHYLNQGLYIRKVTSEVPKSLKSDPFIEFQLNCCFLRNLYPKDTDLPKSRLLQYTRTKGYKIPSYDTKQVDKLFQSTVKINGKKYMSTFWEKSKRWAEQGAAIACLTALGIFDINDLRETGVLRQ